MHTPSRTSFFGKIEHTVRALSPGWRGLFLFFAGMLVVSTAGLLYILESNLVVASPARGGSWSEGVVGTPRFINPVLALSDADRDLTMLAYSGLLRATPEGGYEPDLASRYEISEDGTTYTFFLREGATFHDGSPVTSEDVRFTIEKAKDPGVKSPLRANWEGVAVDTPDPQTIIFTLSAPYAPFIKNATIGILPAHLWESVSAEEFPFSELNTLPIGSGPFEVSSIGRSQGGIPSSYVLSPFSDYTLGEPYLSKLTLRFYQSEEELIEAFQEGTVEAASGISPINIDSLSADLHTAPLNRVFGVFYNQNQSETLREAEVRNALEMAVDREELIEQVLGGHGTPLTGPVPTTLFSESLEEATTSETSEETGDDPALAAQEYLIGRGWELSETGTLQVTNDDGEVLQTISFSLATGNVPELRAAAEYLRATWTRMGAQVDVQVYEPGDLSQNIIRPRKYDALLFGQVIGREFDLFAFWHSSQRNDPGLNVALYANATADDALEELRATAEVEKRAELYETFLTELENDQPALFLYAPDFLYSVSNDIEGLELGFIERPSDRFLSVANWHREVDYVWPFFVQEPIN